MGYVSTRMGDCFSALLQITFGLVSSIYVLTSLSRLHRSYKNEEFYGQSKSVHKVDEGSLH